MYILKKAGPAWKIACMDTTDLAQRLFRLFLFILFFCFSTGTGRFILYLAYGIITITSGKMCRSLETMNISKGYGGDLMVRRGRLDPCRTKFANNVTIYHCFQLRSTSA
jgi:hypothetical protein